MKTKTKTTKKNRSKSYSYSVPVTLPAIIKVDDYHEFRYVADHLKALNRRIRVREVGRDGWSYIGVAYVAKVPCKSAIIDLVNRNRIANFEFGV